MTNSFSYLHSYSVVVREKPGDFEVFLHSFRGLSFERGRSGSILAAVKLFATLSCLPDVSPMYLDLFVHCRPRSISQRA